jgi:hypothetical protein
VAPARLRGARRDAGDHRGSHVSGVCSDMKGVTTELQISINTELISLTTKLHPITTELHLTHNKATSH